MVKRSKGRHNAVSNPVTSFLNAIATLATASAIKIRDFAARIVTRAGPFLKTSPIATDDPVAGKSLWTFLHRIVSPQLHVQVGSHDSPTPTSAKPATSVVAKHPAPAPVARPATPPRLETPAGVPFSSDGPPLWTDIDNKPVQISEDRKYLRYLPPRISGRINRYKELSNLFDTWLISYTRYYPSWGRKSRRAATYIAIESYEGMAEEAAYRVNEDVAVRRHVQEIVELRGFVNSWFEDVIWRKRLPATCGIAEEAKSHIPPYEAMVAVLRIFGGPVP
ncbi:hypothetical protein LTR15_004214 [Elasticomyces elasticus]|nr:hypothetical protein LTR15_004214 [Elasticomyces elasticus]